MRLTLRTLLAYLDDILEASQAKEIGARVSENSVASSLIMRIRDVTRRRRIGSPELSGPGSTPDPNVIAEYLDNTLEPAAVADVEKVCLDSDMHLAEVAASHQILTIVLGEPVTIRPELRERMYALGAPADAVDTPPKPAPPPPAAPLVPEYLKRKPATSPLLPWAAIAVLLGGWVWLIAQGNLLDGMLGRSSKKDANETVAVTEPAPKASEQPTASGEKSSMEKASDEKTRNEVAVVDPQSQPAEEIANPETLVPPPPDLPEEDMDADTDIMADSTTESDGDVPPPPEPDKEIAALTREETPIEVPVASETQAPAAEEVPAVPAPTMMYTTTEGVLVYRAGGSSDWVVMPRRALLHVGDEIACPEPFTADLAVTEHGSNTMTLQLSLAGNSRIRLLPSTADTVIEVEHNRGRLGIFRPTDGMERTLGVGVTVNGERNVFALKSPGTHCGLLVERPHPNGPPPFDPQPRSVGTLFVVAGAVDVKKPDGTTLSSEAAPEWLEWTSTEPAEYMALGTIPVWLDSQAQQPASIRSYARKFEPEFLLDQPVRNSIPAVLQDRRSQISRMAALALALVDDAVDLITALSAEHEETRLTAIVGLREWAAASPENAEELPQLVARAFRNGDIEIVTDLIWGSTVEDIQSEEASLRLVELMGSENIAIRELAFFQVQRITGKSMEYRPLNPPSQREAALARWRDHVKRNKGLVPPPATNP